MHSLVRATRTVIAKLNQPSASCPDHAQPPCPRSTLYSELCSKKLLYKAIQRRRPARQGRSAVELIQRSTALYTIQQYSALHYTALYNPPQSKTLSVTLSLLCLSSITQQTEPLPQEGETDLHHNTRSVCRTTWYLARTELRVLQLLWTWNTAIVDCIPTA